MELCNIETSLISIPEEIGKIGHNMKDKMQTFKIREAECLRDEAKKKLELAVLYSAEKGNKEDTREKIKNEVAVFIFDKKLEVIKAEADWKALDVDYWTADKKHRSLLKSADLFQSEQYQVGRTDKIGKPVFTVKSNLGRD